MTNKYNIGQRVFHFSDKIRGGVVYKILSNFPGDTYYSLKESLTYGFPSSEDIEEKDLFSSYEEAFLEAKLKLEEALRELK